MKPQAETRGKPGFAVVPRILVGLAVIVALVVLAKGVERLLRALFGRLRFDGLLARVGVGTARALRTGEARKTP